jgi:hypothetical protein
MLSLNKIILGFAVLSCTSFGFDNMVQVQSGIGLVSAVAPVDYLSPWKAAFKAGADWNTKLTCRGNEQIEELRYFHTFMLRYDQ